MPVLMLLELPGATIDQYERVNEALGIRGDDDAPAGLVRHAAGHDGNALVVADVWQSEDALDEFVRNRVGPAFERVGIPPAQPRILPVHNASRGRGTEAGVLVIVDVPGLGTDDYDAMIAAMPVHGGAGDQHPAYAHTAARSESGGVLVIDIWDSPQSFARFAEQQIAPAGARIGLGPIEPRFVPVHNVIAGGVPEPAAR